MTRLWRAAHESVLKVVSDAITKAIRTVAHVEYTLHFATEVSVTCIVHRTAIVRNARMRSTSITLTSWLSGYCTVTCHTWRINDVDLAALVGNGGVLRKNGDATLPFQVVGVHDTIIGLLKPHHTLRDVTKRDDSRPRLSIEHETQG